MSNQSIFNQQGAYVAAVFRSKRSASQLSALEAVQRPAQVFKRDQHGAYMKISAFYSLVILLVAAATACKPASSLLGAAERTATEIGQTAKQAVAADVQWRFTPEPNAPEGVEFTKVEARYPGDLAWRDLGRQEGGCRSADRKDSRDNKMFHDSSVVGGCVCNASDMNIFLTVSKSGSEYVLQRYEQGGEGP